jgi:acetolactate synthase small subunit
MQALKQLSDIVNVWAVVDYTGTNSLSRELVMVKVAYMPPGAGAPGSAAAAASASGASAPDAAARLPPSYRALLDAQPHRAAVRDIGELFGAEVVDVGSRHIVFQLTSWSRRIDAFIKTVRERRMMRGCRDGGACAARAPRRVPLTSLPACPLPPLPPSPFPQLEPLGVIEVARSGVVALMRSPVEDMKSPATAASERSSQQAVDASALPPG